MYATKGKSTTMVELAESCRGGRFKSNIYYDRKVSMPSIAGMVLQEGWEEVASYLSSGFNALYRGHGPAGMEYSDPDSRYTYCFNALYRGHGPAGQQPVQPPL